MNLSDYVRKRNGVPLGDPSSLKNMMTRSLGAGTFSKFWRYWNPIWSYYLGKYSFKPLKRIFPSWVALLLTFVICGFVHDLAIMLLRWNFEMLLTPWFLLMGFCVILGDFANVDYSKFTWIVRAGINLLIISSCLFIAYQIRI